MAELAAVGNRAFVVAMTGLAAEPHLAETPEQFAEALRKLALQKDVQLVFVAEPMAMAAPQAVQAFRQRSTAVLLALPLLPSDRHPGLEEVRRLVEQATGAKLI